MTLTVYRELEQGSEEWLAARCGLVTASNVGKLVTPTLKVANNDTSRSLLLTLAAERISGHVEQSFTTADMQRGHDDEPFARDAYAEWAGVEVKEVGFIVSEQLGLRVGYSPDGMVGEQGLIEIKSPRQPRHLSTVLAGDAPTQHMAQMQAGMWVTGRDWCDFISYRDGMHLYVHRVERDDDWMTAITVAATHAEVAICEYVNTYTEQAARFPFIEKRPDLIDTITF